MITQSARHALCCSCCNSPWARIENGALIVESRHHGQKHTNAIALSELLKLAGITQAEESRAA